jgi:hypothetical protein
MTKDPTTLLRLAFAASAMTAAMAAASSSAHEDIRISGTDALVKIEAQDAALSDVMAQLGAMYGVTFQSLGSQDRSISGRYVGPLRKVIGRLLEKDNYVTRLVDGRLGIVVYGSSFPPRSVQPGAIATPPASAQRLPANPKAVMDSGYMR